MAKLENATLLTEVKWMQVQWMEIISKHQEEMQKNKKKLLMNCVPIL
ncbi:hypothetical protein I6G82_23070 [Lysinibacillus macroides]|nr:hypothetical protein [Lysinibacillus macroides]QPR68011.1 hypothetical protein I6G82_23070 [Lysinibacillus macroides]